MGVVIGLDFVDQCNRAKRRGCCRRQMSLCPIGAAVDATAVKTRWASYAVRNWFARTIAVAMSVAAEPMPEPLVLSAAPWTLPEVKAKWAMRSVRSSLTNHKRRLGRGENVLSRRRMGARYTLPFRAPGRRKASMKDFRRCDSGM